MSLGRIARYNPRHGGRAVFAGTRVPVDAVFDYLDDGLSLDYFVESFPSVSRASAEAVWRFGRERIVHELRA